MKRKPLKRHPALIPLSREHHEGLILAQLLKSDVPDYKGLPTTLEGKLAYARSQYEQVLSAHFEKEEQLLVPESKAYGAEPAAMADRVVEEHRRIRQNLEALDEHSSPEEFSLLGRLLERHIRFEEREWFATLQEVLPPEVLEGLKGKME